MEDDKGQGSRCANSAWLRAVSLGCLAAISTATTATAASDGAISFAGKTITVDVSTSAGGGYDFYARELARFLPQHLPGAPTIVVRNMPGAGGIVLANYLYNLAPKDGTEIAAFEGGTPFTSFLNGAQVQFDAAKFGWLGSLDKFVPMVLVWTTRPLYSFDDLKTKQMLVGGSGAGSSTTGYPYSLNAFLGTRIKVINGYPGSAEIALALERGELDGYASWCWDCLKREKPQWLSEKKIRILLQLSFEGDPELTAMGVPTMGDVVKTEEQRKMMSIVLAAANFGRPFTAPPGLSPPLLAEWRKAFEETARDPGLLAELKARRSTIRFAGPKVIEKLLATADTLDAPTLARLQAAYSGADQAK
jgi:tripartite-type tricarboxylate transporter receptor subunit TctC